MQHSTVGTRHALECRYTGPYEVTAVESSSVTLDSPSAKFATPVKCHVDQLKPFVLPEAPTTSPSWDQGLRHQINIPTSPVSSRTRKRNFSSEDKPSTPEPPSKIVTRSKTAQKVQVETPTQMAVDANSEKDDIVRSKKDKESLQSSKPTGRATSPFRSEASALNRPKLGRSGIHLQRASSKQVGPTETTSDKMPPDMHVGQKSISLTQTVPHDSHMHTAQQPTQVIGPSPARPNGQTFSTVKQNTPHPSELDATERGRAANRSNCAETEDNSGSLLQPTSTEQTTLPTSNGQATSTSEHKDETVPANDKTTQTTTHHQDVAVQTNLPEAQS